MLGRPRAWVGGVRGVGRAGGGAVAAGADGVHSRRRTRATSRIAVQLPDAASLQRTEAVVAAGRRVPARGAGGPEHRGARRARPSHPDQPDQQRDDLHQRSSRGTSAGRDEAIDAITGRINGKLFGMKDAIGFAFNLPEIPGSGTTAGVEINLQNRAGQDVRDFAQQVQAFRPGGRTSCRPCRRSTPTSAPTCRRSTSTWTGTAAKARGVSLTRPVRHAAGVPLHALHQRLQPLRPDLPGAGRGAGAVPADAGGHRRGSTCAARTSDDDPGLRADAHRVPERPDADARGSTDSRSALFTGTPKPGAARASCCDAAGRARRARSSPVAGHRRSPTRDSRTRSARRAAGAALVFALGLIIVFLVLAAQYESWSMPFAVLLGVPFGVLGALLGIWLRGTAERHLLPGRADHGGRARGQERDPDRRVRERAPRPGHVDP